MHNHASVCMHRNMHSSMHEHVHACTRARMHMSGTHYFRHGDELDVEVQTRRPSLATYMCQTQTVCVCAHETSALFCMHSIIRTSRTSTLSVVTGIE